MHSTAEANSENAYTSEVAAPGSGPVCRHPELQVASEMVQRFTAKAQEMASEMLPTSSAAARLAMQNFKS